jgi:rubrerythrin
MDIRKIYEYALQREHEGKRFFEENAGRLNHAAAVGAFKELAAEEQKHIEFIEEQIAALDKGQQASIETFSKELKEGAFFSKRAESEMLDQTVLEAMVPDLPVLRTAYLIEKDFAEYYEKSAKEATGEGKKVLQMLAKWERGHETLFKKMHDQAYEIYAQMPWGG